MFSTEHRTLTVPTLAAAVATGICWSAARGAGVDLSVQVREGAGPTGVPLGAVLLATASGGLAAQVLVRLAGRTAHPRRSLALAAAVGLVLSSVPPLQAATSPGAALVLLVMHLVAAAVLLPSAVRLLPASVPAAVQP